MEKKNGVKISGKKIKIVEKKCGWKKKMGLKKISSKSWKKNIIIVSVILKSNCLETKYLELFIGKNTIKISRKSGVKKKGG